MEDKRIKRQNIYKIIMLVILTATITFMLTTMIMYNKFVTSYGSIGIKTNTDGTSSISTTDLVKTLETFKTMIKQKYIGEVDEEKMVEGAIKGFVEGLGDPYTEYLPKEEMTEFTEETSSQYVGIGVYLTNDKTTNTILVVGTMNGSPALVAGMQAGDIIEKVNDVAYTGETMDDAIKVLKGEEGTSAKVTVLRDGKEIELTAEELEAAITPKTKILVLPFPNNPTGAIMTKEELEPIAEFAKEHDIVVISDEIYSELTYGRDHVSIASLPEMKDRSIVINGFSKAFAMTGWRLGYVAAPRYMMKQMVKVHQFCIMAAPTTSQYAAIEAMRSCDDEVEEMRTAYNQRRRFLVHEFQRMGIECFEPEGAFYIFPSIKKFGMTSEEFATKLLNEEKVAIVPGSAFGACGEGYLRVSYAYSIEELKEALGRLERFINHLPKKQ